MRRAVAFVRLARPAFLLGGLAGFGLGAAVARFDGFALDWRAYLGGQFVVTAFHLMVHFANDYFDQETDALAARTPWSGGSGVLPAGALSPRVALVAALACAAAGLGATFVAALAGNAALAGMGLAIGALAWAYSAPPLRLLARGWGELDTVIVVALLVPLAGYAALAGTLGVHALAAAVPGACAMFAMMLAVEIPDAFADGATGKRNLVVRWGVPRAVFVARTAAACAVLLVPVVGSAVFAAPAYAFAAVLPAALVAGTWLLFASKPFLGVALYGLTTCAGIALVLAAAGRG